jgi:uncharacterized membrane protein
MSLYLLLKYLHVLSATVLIGTGAGIAFFMLLASRSKDNRVIAQAARFVVIADWIFTAPAVVLQLGTGLALVKVMGVGFSSPWFIASMALFIFIGVCWLPVVLIQYRLRTAADAMVAGADDRDFRRWMKRWTALGIPAFCAILLLLWLMVTKPLAMV